MALVCALSGAAPEDPVVSSTGYLFERRLIEKHLKDSQLCPISGRDMSVEDLVSVNVSKTAKPRPPGAVSIPGMLSLFQNEWDSTMTEMFTLRQHVEQVRSQLSQTLYQHDAGCRVIARLIRERNALQARTDHLQLRLAELEGARKTPEALVQEPGLSEEDFEKLSALSTQLPQQRKKRNKASPFEPEILSNFVSTGDFPIHSTTNPGILCCTADERPGSSLVATGGMDGHVVLFDVAARLTRTRLLGHMRRVNRVQIHPTEDVILSVSDDKSCRIWKRIDSDSWDHTCPHIVRFHLGPVQDVALHPMGSIFSTVGRDGSWALHDLPSGRTLSSVRDLPSSYMCAQFHPDGALLGAGDEQGAFDIWDMKDRRPHKKIISLEEHKDALTRIAFAESGVHAATSSRDGSIRIWDLRKPAVFHTLTPSENASCTAVTFDKSANFLAATSENGVHLYSFPQKSQPSLCTTLYGTEPSATDVCFGPGAEWIASTGKERVVRIWEAPSDDS